MASLSPRAADTTTVAAYDDNFGYWEIDGPEEGAFFAHVQSLSFKGTCRRCKGAVRLMTAKTICASCVAALECGAPASMRRRCYDDGE